MTAHALPDRSLVQRILVALVCAPVIVWIFSTRGLPLFFFLAGVTLLGQAELYSMFRCRIGRAHRIGGYLTGFLILADAWLSDSRYFFGLLTAFVMYSFLVEIFTRAGHLFERVTLSLFTALYPAAFVAFILKADLFPTYLFGFGKGALFVFVLAVVWVYDSLSYFAGRFFGRRPFFPGISPKKTVEGFVGGLIGGLATGVVFGLVVDSALIVHYMFLSLLISLAGQAGDLSESIVKRNMDAKDSSHIIPGHGGILDRFDSLFFAWPVVYLYLVVLQWIASGS